MTVVKADIFIEPDVAFAVDYSLCEVIRNAIVHGNKYNETKIVTVEFEILNEDENHSKLRFIITDEGGGMNIKEHNHFSEVRNKLSQIISRLKIYRKLNALDKDLDFIDIFSELSEFKLQYFTDFNTFRQLEGKELSGGVGLIQVLNTFDNVEFHNIVKETSICGLKVIMDKLISKKK